MNDLARQKRALTPKQEAFCQHVATGHTLTNAYRMAYDATGMKDSTVNRKASGLHSLPAIRSRVEELAKIEERKSIADRTELLQIATKIVRGGDDVKPSDILKGIEILSRMQGFDSPQTSVSFNVSVRRSPEEMRAILARQVKMSDLPLFKRLEAPDGSAADAANEAGDSLQE